MNTFYEYHWRPGHDIKKPDIKVGTRVLYKGVEYEVIHVDKHVYPVCLKGYGRVKVEDCRSVS